MDLTTLETYLATIPGNLNEQHPKWREHEDKIKEKLREYNIEPDLRVLFKLTHSSVALDDYKNLCEDLVRTANTQKAAMQRALDLQNQRYAQQNRRPVCPSDEEYVRL